LIKINQSYKYHGSAYENCGSAPVETHNLTRVCLFTPVQHQKMPQDSDFLNLLSSIGDLLFFKKRVYTEHLCWDVWSDDASISRWIEKSVRQSDYDFLKWPKGQSDAPKLLIFDMDSTFIQIEVIDELARCHGVGDSVAEVTEAAMRGEIDFSASLVARVACLKGLSQKYIQQIADNLPLSEGVDDLVQACHRHQVKVAIVSGGFTPFVERIKQQMHLYAVKANQLKTKQGQLTGELDGAIIDASAKANFVKQLSQQLQLKVGDILTLGDGANDLKMMHESRFSLAYRAKPAVQEQATGRIESTHLGYLIDVFDWVK